MQIFYHFVFALCGTFCSVIFAAHLAPIVWDSKNEWFRNSPNGQDRELMARIRDTVDIFCPKFNSIGQTVLENQLEYSIIYMVTEHGFKNCILDKPRQVAKCANPKSASVIKLNFRDFTPLPFGLEFKPGQTYFFITTSNGSLGGLYNTQGGLCQSKNLRLKVDMQAEISLSPKAKLEPLPFIYDPLIPNKNHLVGNEPDGQIPSFVQNPTYHAVETKIYEQLNANHPKYLFNKLELPQSDGLQKMTELDQKSAKFELKNVNGFESQNTDEILHGNRKNLAHPMPHLILYEIHETYDSDIPHASRFSNSGTNFEPKFCWFSFFIMIFNFTVMFLSR